MPPPVPKLIHKMVEALLPDSVPESVRNEATAFVWSGINDMPPHFRLPFRLALLGVDCLAILAVLSPLRWASLRTRRRFFQHPLSRMGPVRDVVRAVRTLALMAYYDSPLIQHKMDYDAEAQREEASEKRERWMQND
jgi:hypothetical protein